MSGKNNIWISGALALVAVMVCILMAEGQAAFHPHVNDSTAFTGCLRRTATGYFQLLAATGRVFRVESGNLELSRNVGHTITLYGTLQGISPRAGADPAAHARTTARTRLFANRLKLVSRSCHRR